MLPVGELLIPCVRSEVILASSSGELRNCIMTSRSHELTVTAPPLTLEKETPSQISDKDQRRSSMFPILLPKPGCQQGHQLMIECFTHVQMCNRR